jgi:hypothetical protein
MTARRVPQAAEEDLAFLRRGGWSQFPDLDSCSLEFILGHNKNPGPSGEDADRFGQPRDVG